MYQIKRTDKEIDRQMNMAADWEDRGGTGVFGMTYEQGCKAMFEWLTADTPDGIPIESGPRD